MVQRARELTDADGLRNVTFIHADAEVYASLPEVDIVISRFGTMFFADPVGAFANIGRALRADGRLVMLVWRSAELNEWETSIQRSLATTAFESNEAWRPLDPFSLGEADSVREVLAAAGFAEVTFDDVHEPVFYGRDVDEALAWVGQFASTKDSLGQLNAEAQVAALGRLRVTLAAHHRRGGVRFDSRAWIVTAQRRATERVG
jgi:SAM-dependent methyltransferase